MLTPTTEISVGVDVGTLVLDEVDVAVDVGVVETGYSG
jgi:hypothetical protein